MARRIAMSTLDASTMDILNVIRTNASYEYQQLVPEVETFNDVPKVGEVLYGYPALANQFINALVNRIALVRVKSATFNNQYAMLKKGYLEFGETVEEVFVNIAKAREFNVEKAEARELKRTLPDVRSAFHTMNWRVQYPVTIQQEDLRMAFTNINGVQDLIAKIVDSVYLASEYDEYLLFKYLIIKAVNGGKIFKQGIGESLKEHASAYRGMSNKLMFMSNKYNASGVTTATPREDQIIIMPAEYNAQFDVDVLASAYNMDKATFMGNLLLIDDFTTFDNERFAEIKEGSDMIEDVTDSELNNMAQIKSIIMDKEWFQVYDNNNKFTEKYVASGDYWNYFYNVWKTVSSSPFSNAVAFVENDSLQEPTVASFKVSNIETNDNVRILTFDTEIGTNPNYLSGQYVFEQTNVLTENGIAVHKYGALIIPKDIATLNKNSIIVSFGSGSERKYYLQQDINLNTLTVGKSFEFYPEPAK